MTTGDMLRIENLSKRFGGSLAADSVSFGVKPGTVVGLIGPNGSGKSTLFNLITNILPRDSGSVFFDGKCIDGMPLWKLAKSGIGRTFQDVKVFREITVWENMRIAAVGRKMRVWTDEAAHWLETVGITHLTHEKAENLSIGQQRLLEICIHFFVKPRILLLDEPLAGVNPIIGARIAAIIKAQRAAGATFLIIEHDMRFIMDLCDHVVVLQQGQVLATGTPREVQDNELVIAALLGRQVDKVK